MLNPNDPSSQYSQNNPSSASGPYNRSNFKSPYPQPDLSPPNSQPNWKRKTGCLIILMITFGMMVISCFCSGMIGILHSLSPSIFFQGDFPFGSVGLFVFMAAGFLLSFVMLSITRAKRGRPERARGEESSSVVLGARAGRGRPERARGEESSSVRLGMTRPRPLGKRAGVFAALPVFVTCGIGIFWLVFISSNIGMTRTGFLRTNVSITAGGTVYFRNLDNGVTQILCVGKDQHCQSGNTDPYQFDNGLVIQSGQTVSVVFGKEGTYEITSKTTPHMNITIGVSAPSDSSE